MKYKFLGSFVKFVVIIDRTFFLAYSERMLFLENQSRVLKPRDLRITCVAFSFLQL